MWARGRRVAEIRETVVADDVAIRGGVLRFAEFGAHRLVARTAGGEQQDCSENPSQGAHGSEPMLGVMSRVQIERRLRSVGERLKSARDDLGVTEEQLVQLADEADDARLRSLVSETPIAEKEHRKASRHAERLRKHRDRLLAEIATLDAEQDELLDRLTSS